MLRHEQPHGKVAVKNGSAHGWMHWKGRIDFWTLILGYKFIIRIITANSAPQQRALTFGRTAYWTNN